MKNSLPFNIRKNLDYLFYSKTIPKVNKNIIDYFKNISNSNEISQPQKFIYKIKKEIYSKIKKRVNTQSKKLIIENELELALKDPEIDDNNHKIFAEKNYLKEFAGYFENLSENRLVINDEIKTDEKYYILKLINQKTDLTRKEYEFGMIIAYIAEKMLELIIKNGIDISKLGDKVKNSISSFEKLINKLKIIYLDIEYDKELKKILNKEEYNYYLKNKNNKQDLQIAKFYTQISSEFVINFEAKFDARFKSIYNIGILFEDSFRSLGNNLQEKLHYKDSKTMYGYNYNQASGYIDQMNSNQVTKSNSIDHFPKINILFNNALKNLCNINEYKVDENLINNFNIIMDAMIFGCNKDFKSPEEKCEKFINAIYENFSILVGKEIESDEYGRIDFINKEKLNQSIKINNINKEVLAKVIDVILLKFDNELLNNVSLIKNDAAKKDQLQKIDGATIKTFNYLSHIQNLCEEKSKSI